MIAEFCIRTVDVVSPENPEQYRKLSHAGDVIEIAPAGFVWGKLDLASPNHIIVSLEVESIDKAKADFMAPEPFDVLKNPIPLRKAVKIDLSKLPLGVKEKHESKDKNKIEKEYEDRKSEGKLLIFSDEGDSKFKIPKPIGFDIYSARTLKPKTPPSIFVVGDDPFEVP
jgi:hypothetical protein